MRRMILPAALAMAALFETGCSTAPQQEALDPVPTCSAWSVTARNTMEYTLMIAADDQEVEARSGEAVTFLVKRPEKPRVSHRCLMPEPYNSEYATRCSNALANHRRLKLFETTVVCSDPRSESL